MPATGYDAPLNDNEIALLGLLAETPRYGYEIDKVIEHRGMRDWTDIAFSSIYAVLRALEKRGLVESKTELAGNRARKLYSLTKQGRRALKEQITRLLAIPLRTPDPFMLGISNIAVLDDAVAGEALAERRQALVREAATLETSRDENRGEAYYVAALFDRTLAGLRAELEFIDQFTERGKIKNADTTVTLPAAAPAAVEPIPEPVLEPAPPEPSAKQPVPPAEPVKPKTEPPAADLPDTLF